MTKKEERRDDKIEEELEQAGLILSPDGGWGWIVVIGSFFANVIVDGVIFTVGACFQPKWEEEFHASSGATAWTVSLLSGCYLLVGPLVGALANQFGCRKVAFAGTVIASIGFILSQWANGLPYLYFTFGIMGGVGYGMIYMPAIVIVSYYFEKRRALATGFAVCGSGIGTFVFAPLIQLLLDYYTWQQTMLIISGITLNCFVCAAVFRALKPSRKHVENVTELAMKYQDILVHPEDVVNGQIGSDEIHQNHPPPSPRVAEGIAFERFEKRTNSYSGRPFKSVMELRMRQHGLSTSICIDPTSDRHSQANLVRMVSQETVSQLNRPMSRTNIFYTGSTHNLQLRDVKRGSRSAAPSILTINTSIPAGDEPTGDWKRNILHSLSSILDYSLLKSPCFIILSLGGFLTLCGFFVPFIYLPRHAVLMGHSPEKSTFLVSILGITNICARIFCGWLSDHPKLDALIIHNVAVTLGGVATIVVPFVSSYWLLVLYCIIFGFGTACFAALRSVICVELLGLERLTSAFGFLLLFMGIAALVGSPIAGIKFLFEFPAKTIKPFLCSLHDATGDYTLSFCVMGTLVTLSGLIGIPLRALSRWEMKRSEEYESYQEEEEEEEGEEELKNEHILSSLDSPSLSPTFKDRIRKKLSRVQESLDEDESQL